MIIYFHPVIDMGRLEDKPGLKPLLETIKEGLQNERR
jgi:hypothetical protein